MSDADGRDTCRWRVTGYEQRSSISCGVTEAETGCGHFVDFGPTFGEPITIKREENEVLHEVHLAGRIRFCPFCGKPVEASPLRWWWKDGRYIEEGC